MTEKKLSVKMFGGFTASYGDEVLTFGRQRDSKFGQLFQILMTRPGQGFSKNDVAESLYKWEEVEDTNGSLNNTIFRLRKYLEASPLPAGDYLFLRMGVLYFDGGIEVESDAWNFEKAAREFEKEQDKRKKAELCEKACEFYQGEFLPQLSNEQWVIEKSRYYQKLYFSMMKYLFGYLKGEGDYRSIERLAAGASEIYPYEGWENWRIDSLIALNQHQEAEALYQKAAAHLQESGGFLSKKQQDQFQKIGRKILRPEGGGGSHQRLSSGNGSGIGGIWLYASRFFRLLSYVKACHKAGNCTFQSVSVHHSGRKRSCCRKPGILRKAGKKAACIFPGPSPSGRYLYKI